MNVALNERQQQIWAKIEREGEAKLSELKTMFDVTEMTIRRDLEKLEQVYPVRRIFGGAIMIGRDVDLQERSGELTEEKMRIGRMAASFIQAGDSVFIDGGSTTIQVARAIPAGMNITVVTNAMNVAVELMGKNIPTIVTGGMIRAVTSTLVGPISTQTISAMAFTRIFLGATGVSAEHGFSTSNMDEAEAKKLATRQTGEVNIVVDHTKYDAKVLVSFAALSAVHRIISDQPPELPLLRACRKAGVGIVPC